MLSAQLLLALAAWPAQFHLDVFSICRTSGNFVFSFTVVFLTLSFQDMPNMLRSKPHISVH